MGSHFGFLVSVSLGSTLTVSLGSTLTVSSDPTSTFSDLILDFGLDGPSYSILILLRVFFGEMFNELGASVYTKNERFQT